MGVIGVKKIGSFLSKKRAKRVKIVNFEVFCLKYPSAVHGHMVRNLFLHMGIKKSLKILPKIVYKYFLVFSHKKSARWRFMVILGPISDYLLSTSKRFEIFLTYRYKKSLKILPKIRRNFVFGC